MKRRIFITLLLISVGVFLSCEKMDNPPVYGKYLTLYEGQYGNGTYELPSEGVYYTSDEDVEIDFIFNRDTIYQPQFSLGVYSENKLNDTVFVFADPGQLVLIMGKGTVIRYIE
jgi:hypothetical protein